MYMIYKVCGTLMNAAISIYRSVTICMDMAIGKSVIEIGFAGISPSAR